MVGVTTKRRRSVSRSGVSKADGTDYVLENLEHMSCLNKVSASYEITEGEKIHLITIS